MVYAILTFLLLRILTSLRLCFHVNLKRNTICLISLLLKYIKSDLCNLATLKARFKYFKVKYKLCRSTNKCNVICKAVWKVDSELIEKNSFVISKHKSYRKSYQNTISKKSIKEINLKRIFKIFAGNWKCWQRQKTCTFYYTLKIINFSNSFEQTHSFGSWWLLNVKSRTTYSTFIIFSSTSYEH